MFELKCSGWSYLPDLQIVQADIALDIEDTIVLDEPFCVHVGIGALLLSAFEDVYPKQFNEDEDWRVQPFFICGCGDSSCRAALFEVRHLPEKRVQWCELMQSEYGSEWRGDVYEFDLDTYRQALLSYGHAYVAFLREHESSLGEELRRSLQVVVPLLQRLTDQMAIG
jgi:hypothetical protein